LALILVKALAVEDGESGMNQVRDSRSLNLIRCARRLGGASALAIAAGFGAAPADAQATPGSAQCPIVNRIVTCSGNLPEGVRVPAGADRDGLTVENLAADITLNFTTATARPAIDYTAGTPTSTIRIVDPDNRLSVTTAAPATAQPQNQVDLLTSAILLTATDNSNFSLLSDIDIVTRATCPFADCIRRREIMPNGITVRGSLGNFAIDNRGDIGLDINVDTNANPNAILVDVFNADLVTIRNSGNLTAVNAGGIYAPIYARRIEITNDGSITLQNDRTSIGGISLLDFDQPYADGFVRPAMPESIDFTYRIVNNGSIRITGSVSGAGIRHDSSYIIEGGFVRDAIGTGEIVNNGTIEAVFGILLSHSGEVTITNNGRIEGENAMFVIQSGFGSVIARIANTASGVIVTNQGIIVDGGIADVSNAGRIEASGVSARGINLQSGISTLDSATIRNSGQIAVTGDGSRAVEVFNSEGPTLFTNSGTITAEGDNAVGLYFEHETFDDEMPEDLIGTTDVDLAATSIIRGGSGADGAGIFFFGGERNVVRNAGLISSQSGRAIVGGAGAETIDNSGRIEGSVALGAGNDRLVARDGGLITGAVDGGTGDDVLHLDVASGTAAFADRFGGAVTGFELLEKTGAGTMTLNQAVAPRFALLGGTLVTSGNLSAVQVDTSSGTTLASTGRLGAVTLADGAILSPGGGAVGTVELASLSMAGTSRLRFDLGSPSTIGGTESDLINVTGNLVLDGLLDINARPNFGDGIYRLVNYGGSLTDNGLAIGSAPAFNYIVQTSIAGQVNLVVGGASVQFWDGSEGFADGEIDGGSGTWNNTDTNWTTIQAQPNDIWRAGFAVFQRAPGTVTIAPGGVSASGLQFAIDGYRIEGGTLTLTAPAILRVGDGSAGGAGYTATIASIIAGNGGIDKTDLGTLVLAGANTYSGGTRISGGALQIGADNNLGAAAGDVTLDGGALRFGAALSSGRAFTIGAGGGAFDTLANAVTLSGALSGAGGLTKVGNGTLTYTGNGSAYSGRFTIADGSLRHDGSIGGTLQVNAGARLSGGGTLGDLDLLGTLAPGASIGTLTVNGNAVFRAGSTYEVEIAAAGGADGLTVAGTATIEGGTVRVITLGPETQYVDGASYTFLTAAGGLTGQFTGLSESSAFLDFALSYGANSATVTVDVVRMFPDVAQTFNQRQSSTALAALSQGAGSDGLAVYNQLLMLDEGPARSAFDAASGEIYPVLLAATLRHGAGRVERLLGRSRESGGEGWGLWGTANGHDGRTQADGNGARYTQSGIGGELGIDYRGPGNGWAIGFGGGYDDRNVDLRDRASHADVTGWHAGGFARFGTGGAGLTASISGAYARGEAEVTRGIAFGSLARVASAPVDVDAWALAGELRYGFRVGGGWSLGPALHVDHARAELGRFAEAGGASLALSGDTGNDDARTRYGGGVFARWDGANGSVDAAASYVGGDRDPTEVGLAMAGAPATPYRVRSAQGDGGAVRLSLAGRYALGGGWAVGANVEGAAGNSERSLQGSTTLSWRF
jgi:autotransporter-associated beta strand protein